MRWTFLRLITLTGFLATSPFCRVAFTDDLDSSPTDDAVVIRTVLEQVAAAREEVVSAEIHYQWHISTYRNPENTPERVQILLRECDLVDDPESLQRLVDALGPFPALTAPVWDTRDFVMLGERRRAESQAGNVRLVDADHEISFDQANRQLDVTRRGGSSIHREHIEDFRAFPPEQITADQLRLIESSEGMVTLGLKPVEDSEMEGELPSDPDTATTVFTFDEATGVMTHAAVFDESVLYSEDWQQALTGYPGGVTMPAVRIKTLYQNGALKSLTVWKIEEARFNEPVGEDRFVLGVPAETVLVDSRLQESVVREVVQAVPDVRSVLVPILEPGVRGADGVGFSWRMILILNGVGLIALAVWLWKKGSLSSRPPSSPRRGAPRTS